MTENLQYSLTGTPTLVSEDVWRDLHEDSSSNPLRDITFCARSGKGHDKRRITQGFSWTTNPASYKKNVIKYQFFNQKRIAEFHNP